ncbi:MAG TPA: FHA domain-containing protein, partial [Waddliaceae bacterium]
MIKIILNPGSGAETFIFEKQVVLLGTDASQADVVIRGESVEKTHLKIQEESDCFLVINLANDPFTSINGLPFGKKKITAGDTIQIGTLALHLELSKSNITASDKPVAQEIKPETAGSDSGYSLNADLEDDKIQYSYLEEIEQENERWKGINEEEKNFNKFPLFIKHWKMLVGIAVTCLLLCALAGSGIYFRATGKNSQEEKKIAAGIADIAMAMIYANKYHIAPSKQNWADPDFINANLSRVLSPNLHSQAQIDNQGQFTRHPYILRVYTSSDVSRFLIIAQPAPNFLQWIINKTSIVIDSTTMEIRKVFNIKSLNKLLANSNPLEGKNGVEISRLVQRGTLMSLESLSGNKNLWGFSPPKALSLIRPGSENYLYNAPRYHPFGESVLQRAVELSQNHGNSSDISLLHEEIGTIEGFDDIILYSSQGLQTALEAQQALSTFFPGKKFLVAYLKFGSNGHVGSSHLLIDDDHRQMSSLEPKDLLLRNFKEASSPLLDINENKEEISSDKKESNSYKQRGEDVDIQHPLFLQLQAINVPRQRALKPVADDLFFLLTQHTQEILPDFSQKFGEMLKTFEITDNQQQARMIEDITHQYEEYSDMPLEEFRKYIRATGLSPFVKNTLMNRLQNKGSAILEDDLELYFHKVMESTNLDNLEESVRQTASILNIDYLPDPEKLISHQDRLRAETFQKLVQFLLSSKNHI